MVDKMNKNIKMVVLSVIILTIISTVLLLVYDNKNTNTPIINSTYCYVLYAPTGALEWNISDPYSTRQFEENKWLTEHILLINNQSFKILIVTECFPPYFINETLQE